MTTLVPDLRYGLRMLVRSPGATLVMIATLALGVGANTAIFSVVYGVLLRPLPYPKPDQIVSLQELNHAYTMNFADPNFDDLRASNHSLTGIAEYQSGVSTIVTGSGPARAGVAAVSQDFFRVMGVSPVLGRGFAPEELHVGASPSMLVSYDLWQQSLAGAIDLASLKVKMDDKVCTVVGVLPRGFGFPDETKAWIPRELFEHLPSRTAHNWHVIARVRDGQTVEQAHLDLGSIAKRLKGQFGDYTDMTDVGVTRLRDSMTGGVRRALLILLGAVGFLLLVASANVANLQLARAAARERELAIRSALGAGRGRLLRQFLAEALLLALAGGVVGVLAALWGVSALVALAPPNLPRLGEVSVNLPVLAFALGVSVLVAVSLGVLTALRATSGDPQEALAEGARGHAGSRRSQRLGRVLVSSQLAISLVLLVGAGLLGRSLMHVVSVDPGFRTENILTMEIELPSAPASGDQSAGELGPGYEAGRPAAFVTSLFEHLRAIPGVQEVGGSTDLPLAGAGCPGDGTFLLLDRQPKMEDFERLAHSAPTGYADYCVASEGYFGAFGIPLVRGRLFDAHDSREAPPVALISESLARATWPNQNPLGKTIEFGNMDGDMRLLTIVGIVGDVRDQNLETPPKSAVYVDYRQRPLHGQDFNVVIRSSVAPTALLGPAREIVRSLDPDVSPRLRSFQQVFAASLDSRRFNLELVAAFAGTALLLAAVGIYGVMAFWVERRRREIGVRMALGAVGGDVLRLVLRQAAWTAAVGVLAGLAGAFALTRTMQSMLFGVSADDPVTFAGVALLLAGVALLASYVPARRATKVDPMVALRYE
ncbi:MAG TPA: ABC transporter permease [Terriglobia bacterium]|nr:ABC transporter permease [Terriglobia bacterium]